MVYSLPTRGAIALAISLFASGIFSKSITNLNEIDGDFLDLRAASRSSALLRRSSGIQVVRNAELSFVDSENHDTQHSIFYSRVSFESKTPFVVLEDMEHHLADIFCNTTEIELQFLSKGTFDEAVNVFTGLIGSYIVTSHAGCNADGTRAPFLIQSISASDNLLITLSAKEVPWRQAFQKFKISYGHCSESHVVRSHSTNILRRQTTPETNVPAETPTDTIVDIDLGFKSLNSDFGLGDSGLGCKDCTTTGRLKITQGNFAIEDDIDIDTDLFDVITEGSVQLDMNFAAHIELKAKPSDEGELDHVLFTKPLVGFKVGMIGKAGIKFEPTLHLEWVSDKAAEVSSGFDFKIPDKSQIFLNLANPNESTVTGFDQSTITAVPFQSNVSDINLLMQIALRPRIAIGFNFFKYDDTFGEIGFHLDLPNAAIAVEQIPSASSNPKDCSSSTIQASSLTAGDKDFQAKYINLTHITTSIGLAVGLDASVLVKNDILFDFAANFTHQIWNSSLTGWDSCLVFQGAGKDFREASSVSDELNGKKPADKKGAAGRLVGMFGAESWYGSVLSVCLYSLGITAVGFGFF